MLLPCILSKKPEWFKVVVTPNMFGDIITDLGAMIQGGLGVAVGGNINPEGVSMFEPVHGSAPDIAGLGKADPTATVNVACDAFRTYWGDSSS